MTIIRDYWNKRQEALQHISDTFGCTGTFQLYSKDKTIGFGLRLSWLSNLWDPVAKYSDRKQFKGISFLYLVKSFCAKVMLFITLKKRQFTIIVSMYQYLTKVLKRSNPGQYLVITLAVAVSSQAVNFFTPSSSGKNRISLRGTFTSLLRGEGRYQCFLKRYIIQFHLKCGLGTRFSKNILMVWLMYRFRLLIPVLKRGFTI